MTHQEPALDVKRLRVFLCHSSGDKSSVRDLHRRLTADGFLPWLDEEDLLPGQDWGYEIRTAVRQSDVVAVCLSRSSITKMGFVQKEIKHALDAADEQPEGMIFLIPVKLEECQVPDRLRRWHWVNYFEENGYAKLIRALRERSKGTEGPSPDGPRTVEAPSLGRTSNIQPVDSGSAGKHPEALRKSRVDLRISSRLPSWIFGSLFTLFILAVFVFAPATLPEFKQKLLTYVCGLLAAFFAFFFTGTLKVSVTGGVPGWPQIAVKSAGGLGAFVLTLWWWSSGVAPVKPASPVEPLRNHLTLIVKDAVDDRAISRATIASQGTPTLPPKITDGEGSVVYEIAPPMSRKSIALRIDAPGYDSDIETIELRDADVEREIKLRRKASPPDIKEAPKSTEETAGDKNASDHTSERASDTYRFASISVEAALGDSTSPSDARRREAIRFAESSANQTLKYKYGGKSVEEGFDTASYIAYILNYAGVKTGDIRTIYSGKIRGQFYLKSRTIRPGDLFYFRANDNAVAVILYTGNSEGLTMVPGGVQRWRIDTPHTLNDTDQIFSPVGAGNVDY
jgi:hypothetical protein